MCIWRSVTISDGDFKLRIRKKSTIDATEGWHRRLAEITKDTHTTLDYSILSENAILLVRSISTMRTSTDPIPLFEALRYLIANLFNDTSVIAAADPFLSAGTGCNVLPRIQISLLYSQSKAP